MTAKVVWHSDKNRKRGTIRIVLIRETPENQSSPITLRIEERIRDNALGDETWIPFDNERLPSWVTALISEFVYNRRNTDE